LEIKMKKLLIFLFLGMFLISLTSASLGFYKQGECVNIKTILNSTWVNISTISSPNSTVIYSQQSMQKVGQTFNFSFCNTSDLGNYIYDYYDNSGKVYVNDFEITYSGDSISEAQAILYIGLFAVLLFIFFVTLFGINQLPQYNQQDEEGKILSISYLKYLRPVLWFFEWMLFVAMLYLSSNVAFAYQSEQLFASILFRLFQITFGITPLIVVVWMIWIFVSMFHDKQFQKMLNRGIFPQGRLP